MPAPRVTVSQPDYDVVMARNFMLPMRDGVRLATDIYRPAKGVDPLAGPFPTLLVRTPYDKSGADTAKRRGDYFARRGYNVVIQDTRGRYASEGDFYLFAKEAPDGYDTMVWIYNQPWCNGKIGTMGTSYLAWVQNALAALNPPGLAAMIVNQGAHNGYTSALRHNGAFELRFFAWAFMGVATSPEAIADPVIRQAAVNTRSSDWIRPIMPTRGQTPLGLIPAYEDWAFEFLQHGDNDEFWQSPSLNFGAHIATTPDVPMLYSSAWYDSYTRANMENFVAFSQAKRSPVRAVMGPWTHGDVTVDRTWSGDVEFGPTASLAGNLADDFMDFHLRYFDYHLKGIDSGEGQAAPLRLFVMGGGDGRKTPNGRLFHGGQWRDEQEWPLARTRFTPFYLSPGKLAPKPPENGAVASSFRFDPLEPVPTIGGNISSLADFFPIPAEIADRTPVEARWGNLVKVGPQNQTPTSDTVGAKPPYAPLNSRADVLSFETAPLASPVELTGPLKAVLWVSTTTPDTDFTVKLVDVYPPNPDYPNGYAMNISDSILRLRYRDGTGQPSLATPGEVYRIDIEMYPTSNVFGQGHKIRLDISSSNFPRFDVNPNTGDPVGANTYAVATINTVYHSAARPSHIVLPVIPA